MTILATCQRLAPFIGVDVPLAVIGSSEREHVEMAALAYECAAQIAEAHTWQKLKTLYTITGDGSTTAYTPPDDFGWIPEGQKIRSASVLGEITWTTDHDFWLENQLHPFGTVTGMATLLGGQIQFNPVRSDGEVIKTYYQTNEWAEDVDGIARNGFAADTDSYRLSEDMLFLCMRWKWRGYKGLPYSEELQAFEDDFTRRVWRDKGPRGFSVGRRGVGFGSGSSGASEGASTAFPFTIPFEIS